MTFLLAFKWKHSKDASNVIYARVQSVEMCSSGEINVVVFDCFFLMVIKLKTEFCTCFTNIISYFAFVYYYNIYSTHTYIHTQYLLMCGQNDYKKVCQGNLRVKVVNITSDKWQILFVLILYSCAFSLKCSTKSTNL